MKHMEGGWPENTDPTEADQVERYLKKANKDARIRSTVQSLAGVAEMCIKQNNTIDIYEEYFDDAKVDTATDPLSAKGLAVFRDPNEIKRTATSINWHPDGGKMAVAYSVLNFQDDRMMHHRMPAKSYIWDITNPNSPERHLVPPSPLVCLRYNHKFQDILVGGCYNGLISIFDVKARNSAVLPAVSTSEVATSHFDPVYDVFWVQSKTHKEFASVSTDGRMLKWDMRSLKEPTASYDLKDPAGNILGGSSMEYNVEGGSTTFLVGTEQGAVLTVNTKKRGDQLVTAKDMGVGKHHGPVYSIQRNPTHPKTFLTVGDWTARIWADENSTPIMTTSYSPAYLTAGCWSPTRAGVFFTARMDGVLDVWDIYFRQSECAYSHKVGEHPLSSIAVQGSPQAGGGKLVAVGDMSGTVSLLELSDSLSRPQPDEKLLIGSMLDREKAREKHLEKRAAELARLRAKKAGAAAGAAETSDEMESILRQVDAEFLAMIKEAEEESSAR